MLLEQGVRRDSMDVADLRHFYVVSYVNMMPTEDETFYVVVLSDRLWVMPDNVEALQVFLDAIVPRATADGHISHLVATTIPFRWRMRVWGLPVFPVVRLSTQPLDSLPRSKWEERPLDKAQIKELTWVNV